MRKLELDDQGKVNIGPVGGTKPGKINVAFDSSDTSGIGLHVEATPAAGSARASIKLGGFTVGQDPDADGSEGFGVVDANGEDCGLRVRTVTLTAADLGGLTIIELIPAPSADKVICVVSAHFKTTNADSVADLAPRLVYGNDDVDLFSGAELTISNVGVDGTKVFPSADGGREPIISSVFSYGAAVNLFADYDPLPVTGGLLVAAVAAGGTGWAVNDTFTIHDATCKVLTVNSGAIVTFQILTPGVGSHLTPLATPVAATDASGTGVDATFEITGIDWSVNPLTVKVQLVYTII